MFGITPTVSEDTPKAVICMSDSFCFSRQIFFSSYKKEKEKPRNQNTADFVGFCCCKWPVWTPAVEQRRLYNWQNNNWCEPFITLTGLPRKTENKQAGFVQLRTQRSWQTCHVLAVVVDMISRYDMFEVHSFWGRCLGHPGLQKYISCIRQSQVTGSLRFTLTKGVNIWVFHKRTKATRYMNASKLSKNILGVVVKKHPITELTGLRQCQ